MKPFTQIQTAKIKGYFILLDIDGTLTYDSGTDMSADTKKKVSELKAQNEIVLCSNRNDHVRNRKVADILNVKYLETNHRKPSKKILKTFKTKNPLLVIGDKFLTDGYFAKRIKADLVMVKRIRSAKETWVSKGIYLIDDTFARIFHRN
jgi:predicted HAD superfamily phosphohydrolase YqeG